MQIVMTTACHFSQFDSIWKEYKDEKADTFVKLQNFFDHGRKVIVEAHMVEWSHPRQQLAGLTNELERKSLNLQTMPGFLTDAVQLRQELSGAWTEIYCRASKLALLREVRYKITEIMVNKKKVQSSVKKARE